MGQSGATLACFTERNSLYSSSVTVNGSNLVGARFFSMNLKLVSVSALFQPHTLHTWVSSFILSVGEFWYSYFWISFFWRAGDQYSKSTRVSRWQPFFPSLRLNVPGKFASALHDSGIECVRMNILSKHHFVAAHISDHNSPNVRWIVIFLFEPDACFK